MNVQQGGSWPRNNKLVADGKEPASGHPLLLGITKASLSTEFYRKIKIPRR